MDRLRILRRQLIFDCGDDLRALLGGIAVCIGARFAAPQLFKISGVDVRFLQRFEQIVIVFVPASILSSPFSPFFPALSQ